MSVQIKYFIQFLEITGTWGVRAEIPADNDDQAREWQNLYSWEKVRIIKQTIELMEQEI